MAIEALEAKHGDDEVPFDEMVSSLERVAREFASATE